MKSISFSKYSGCGNDFIIIDNRQGVFPTSKKSLIHKLCQRHLGVGAAGIILLENSAVSHFRMRIFNADGKEVEMCGNGLRCLGKYLFKCGITGRRFDVEVTDQIYSLTIENDLVCVSMIPPKKIRWAIEAILDQESVIVDYLNTGVPHAVIFCSDLENIDINVLGPKIRYHSLFSPQGTNVNWVKLDSQGTLALRTYERGVEQETLACGTGAAAAAITAAIRFQLKSPIKVLPRSGEHMEFKLTHQNNQITQLVMKGPASFIYKGELQIPDIPNFSI